MRPVETTPTPFGWEAQPKQMLLGKHLNIFVGIMDLLGVHVEQ